MQLSILLIALFAIVSSYALIPVTIVDPLLAIEDEYIIIFREDITDDERSAHMTLLAKGFAADSFENLIFSTYTIGDYKGFSGRLSQSMLATQQASSNVILIEKNSKVQASQSCSSQNGATWGIDRIAEQQLNLDGVYRYGATGAGVDSYVVDTGININHVDFQGRAIWGANFVDTQNTDCNGHGTHVAGTMGSKTYGVAKATTLIAVKVLNCQGSGTNAGVINGINWVATSYNSRKRPSVANMSLGGGKSTATDNAVNAAVKAGVTFVVAAGNDDADACGYSPASATSAISVGATGTDAVGNQQVDNRAYFSNFGSCVHIFAPGLEITSTWIGSKNNEINTISGTSMASPHVAGAVSLYLQNHPTATPASVKSAILGNAVDGLIELDCATTACKRSPNVFLYSPCSP